MPLNKEWLRRVQRWESSLWGTCYQRLEDLSLAGFTTYDHLTPEQALQNPFSPMPLGLSWGAKWEYGWFKTRLIVPPQAAGCRLVLTANPAFQEPSPGECLIWVNGRAVGSSGWARHFITLAIKAIPGMVYNILIEAYAGHGKLVVDGGPQPYGSNKGEDPPITLCTIGHTSFGIWREEIYQLAVDFSTLLDIHNNLDTRSLRVSEIAQGLMDATLLVDPESPDDEYFESAQRARERLQPLLACKNGSTSPLLYAFGHAHLDIAWLWPLQETARKMARTIANQLELIEEFPEYRFLQSQPYLYQILQSLYPQIYTDLKSAVESGRIIADGSMWVEADTNLTSGESLIRQILYGKRFFQDEFGIESNILWLPDVFGYSGALPQILRGCGCVGFATQKITWAYYGGEPFPYNTFLWEGIDGTAIPAHIFTDYNSQTRPSALLERWNTRLQLLGIDKMILAFGWGDGGGGPTRDHLEYLRRALDLEGVPRIKYASPSEFFTDIPSTGALPRYVGELYFQGHRGTYTSQARIKKANRRLEFSLREAEFWGCIASLLGKNEYPKSALESTWQILLLNQFHDILPGSSIHRVYEEAEINLENAIIATDALTNQALNCLLKSSDLESSNSGKVTVVNSLSWPRTTVVQLNEGQVEVTIPPCGWTTIQQNDPVYRMPTIDGLAFGNSTTIPAHAEALMLENENLLAKFNEQGELTSLVLKPSGWEAIAGCGNQFRLYKDIPSSWDAWDIDSNAELQLLPSLEPVNIEVLNPGPMAAQLRLTRSIGNSSIDQVITLHRGSHRLEFKTSINWLENHRLLKVAFPFNLHATEAIHEIQFGHLRRPTHRSRQYDADRFEVCNHKWSALADELHGAAVLNDSKYGLSVDGSTIKLSVLRAPMAPDPQADRGLHIFTYAIYPWVGPLAQSRLIQEAYELNVPPLVLLGDAGEASFFQINAPNIILETLKLTEDGTGDIILRLYESLHTTTQCWVDTALPVTYAFQTNLLETDKIPLKTNAGKIHLEFQPFEIKTIRLQYDGAIKDIC